MKVRFHTAIILSNDNLLCFVLCFYIKPNDGHFRLKHLFQLTALVCVCVCIYMLFQHVQVSYMNTSVLTMNM